QRTTTRTRLFTELYAGETRWSKPSSPPKLFVRSEDSTYQSTLSSETSLSPRSTAFPAQPCTELSRARPGITYKTQTDRNSRLELPRVGRQQPLHEAARPLL